MGAPSVWLITWYISLSGAYTSTSAPPLVEVEVQVEVEVVEVVEVHLVRAAMAAAASWTSVPS